MGWSFAKNVTPNLTNVNLKFAMLLKDEQRKNWRTCKQGHFPGVGDSAPHHRSKMHVILERPVMSAVTPPMDLAGIGPQIARLALADTASTTFLCTVSPIATRATCMTRIGTNARS